MKESLTSQLYDTKKRLKSESCCI